MKPYDWKNGYRLIAKSLRDFGYKDCTPKMIAEVHEAYKEGKREGDLPHGIIGRFAQRQIAEAEEMLKRKGWA